MHEPTIRIRQKHNETTELPLGKGKKKKAKIRAEFRKNHDSRVRNKDITREFQSTEFDGDDYDRGERYSGKGRLTRKRTIIGESVENDETGLRVQLEIDLDQCVRGRVLSVHGLASQVLGENGQAYRCAVRGLLKNLATDQRNVAAAGDLVYVRPEEDGTAVIERVEPRHGVISRMSKGRQHVMVANVDQLLIVASAAEPYLKPNLIDRFLITADKSEIQPIVLINKVDLVDRADLQPTVGVFAQMGYQVLLVSAETGFGVDRLRRVVSGKQSVVAGQSGVGKSSLLNAIDEGLHLKVNTVSSENQKGRHTTTTSSLIPICGGGFVVDTPGVRQFQLWDVIPDEVAGYFRDIRPYVSRCRYPDCTHTHEDECTVKDAVADARLDARRYESYVKLFAGDEFD
jgi:ribosome biogenesis GTPase